ncbi:Metallo-dependent phosphatase-like protein [Butyriboletus roseoflavus]|nr:Metallo-dependent phosphatase-like protein [Butyriboletus roseoflavus]
MARSSTVAFVAFSLLILSLAYLAQPYVSPLGPAPHLGTGPRRSAILSTLVNYVQAAVYAPFATQQHPLSAKQKADAANSEVTIDEPRPRFSRRIIAVGDIHGDLFNAGRVLQMAGVVDEDGNWSGNVDVFVQTGDIIDRGDDTIELFQWMEDLREQAHGMGGEMISILGNHEWMNAIGEYIYVYPTEIETFGSISARQKAVTTGWLGSTWSSNYTTAARLPLHSLLGPPNTDYPPEKGSMYARANAGPLSHAAFSFVHGGLSPAYPSLQPYPSAINNLSATLLRRLRSRSPQPPPHPPHAYPGLPVGTTREEARLYGADGPLWYRGWAEEAESKACAQVDKVLEKTGTRRMVMGHTPHLQNIVARCGGKVLIIDTGISHAYGGALSALSIEYSLEPVKGGGWKEQEVVKALYAEQEDELLVTAVRDGHVSLVSSPCCMSVTPTPSTASDQISLYYDALVMQFSPLTDDATGQGSGPADPRPGASGHPNGTNQHTHANGMSSPSKHADDEARQKTPSLHSLPIEPDGQEKQTSGIKTIFGRAGGAMGRKESVRTTRSTHTTGGTSAFADGAPLMGPNAEPDVDESLFARSAKAERSLSQKQKNRIMTEEKKESKKFSKLLKMESTTEKVALASALKSLSALQSLHKAAIKREASAGVSHAKALSAAQKAESRFQEEKSRTTELRARAETRCAEERARWEGKEGEVLAQQERLDSAREAVKEMEVRIAECARDVERLRIVKAMDERERGAKIIELAGQK